MKKIKNNQDEKIWTYHQTENAQNLVMGYPRQEMLFKKIKKLIQSGKILEIGFGDGYFLNKLKEKYDCYGADISQKNVNQVKKKLPEVKFKLIGIDGKLPYKNNFFDGFIASEVLEHMSDQELNVSLKEIKRVLKKNGLAFITFPAQENLQNNNCLCPECGAKFHRWGHKQIWDDEKIKKKFNQFILIQKKEFFVPYQSKNFMENLAGYFMFLARNVTSFFINIPNKNYFIILKNK